MRPEASPRQAPRQESRYRALIGGKHSRIVGLFDRVAKGLEAERLGPEKHLEHKKIDVQRRYQRHQGIRDPKHAPSPRQKIRRMSLRPQRSKSNGKQSSRGLRK